MEADKQFTVDELMTAALDTGRLPGLNAILAKARENRKPRWLTFTDGEQLFTENELLQMADRLGYKSSVKLVIERVRDAKREFPHGTVVKDARRDYWERYDHDGTTGWQAFGEEEIYPDSAPLRPLEVMP